MSRPGLVATALAVLALVGSASAACGGGDDGGDNGNGIAPTAAASPTDADDASGDSGALTLVGKNTLWDKTELSATAGEITIEVDNQDAGIVHNVHVYKGSDATGDDLGMTDLEAGPAQQTLTFTAEPGEHYYVCDAHPATMAGTLTVS